MTSSVKVRTASGWTVVTVGPELDISTAPRLREKLIDLIAAGQRSLVIDMEAVTFVDSTALGVLVGALKRVRTAGGELRIVATGDAVLRPLRITGLHRVFGTYASVKDAVAAPPADAPLTPA